MKLAQLGEFGARPPAREAPNLSLTGAPDLARANRPKKHRAERAASRRATSIGWLRWFCRSTAWPGFCSPAWSYDAHFLHSRPLLWPNHHNKLGYKDVILQGSACHKVIAHLHVGHGDGVSSFTQRGVLVELNCLRDVVGAQHRNLGRVDGLHFARHVVFSHRSRLHVRPATFAV